jgi:transposase-like protein
MRYPASEKLEIIGLVEQSHVPARRTLQTLGILPSRFYRWYDRYQTGGPEALEDRPSKPDRVWNKIPDTIRDSLVQLALDERGKVAPFAIPAGEVRCPPRDCRCARFAKFYARGTPAGRASG